MSKVKIKILLSILLLISLIFGGLFYYVSKKITPEEVRKHTVDLITQALPGANVELGEITYSLGTSIKFKINNLKLTLKGQQQVGQKNELASVSQLDVKVPIWALIMRKGTIAINIDTPVAYFVELEKGKNNWGQALNIKTTVTESSNDKEESLSKGKSELMVPSALVGNKLDVKITNLSLKYVVLPSTKGEVLITRLFLKNFNFTNASAFEVASQFNQSVGSGKNQEVTQVEAVLIGQVNLGQYISTQELNSTMVLTLSNLKISSFKRELPPIKADLKLNLNKLGEVVVDVDSTFSSLGNSKFKLSILKDKSLIQISEFEIILKELFDLLDKSSLVRSENSKLKMHGSINVLGQTITPNLNFNIDHWLGVELSPKVKLEIMGTGEIVNNDLTLKMQGKTLQGDVDVNFKSKLDLNAKSSEEKLGNLNASVNIKNIQISKSDLHELIYKDNSSSNENAKSPPATIEDRGDKSEAPKTTKSSINLPKLVALVKWSNINVGGESFQGDFKLVTNKNVVSTDNLKFIYSKGTGSIKFNTELLPQDVTITKLDAQVQTLNLDSFMPFLPSNLESLKGIFSGQARGEIKTFGEKKAPSYNLTINVNAKDGEIKKLNVAEYVKDAVAGIPLLKDKILKEGVNLSNKFEILDMSGVFKEDHFQISKFFFTGSRGALMATGHGDIYPLPGTAQSEFEFDLTDKGKLSQDLKRNIGQENLPLRMVGPQYSLRPDFEYTLKKIAKSALKTQAKEPLKKLGDKLLNENKDDLKKLFNSFIKK